MSILAQQELAKVRKTALQSITLSSEMKTAVADVRLKELVQELKKLLIKKELALRVICF